MLLDLYLDADPGKFWWHPENYLLGKVIWYK